MQNIATKATGDSLTASEFNQIPDELENAITSVGIALSGGDVTQLGKAISYYAASGSFYTDSGAANAYVLSVIGSKFAPPDLHNGMVIAFVAAFTNTTISTVNVTGLGVKTIKMPNGSDTVAGSITAGKLIVARYNGVNFILSNETMVGAAGTAEAMKSLVLDANLDISGQRHITQKASAGSDLYNTFKDETGADKALIWWQRSPNAIEIRKYAANNVTVAVNLTLGADGSAAINGFGIWNAGNLAAGTRGTHVSGTVASTTSGVAFFMPFNTESYDTDAIHDNVTNNSRLTVPAGVSKVRISANARYVSTNGGFRSIIVYKNNVDTSTLYPSTVIAGTNTATNSLNASSSVLNVSPGDYFELQVSQNSGVSIDVTAWFAMEIIK